MTAPLASAHCAKDTQNVITPWLPACQPFLIIHASFDHVRAICCGVVQSRPLRCRCTLLFSLAKTASGFHSVPATGSCFKSGC